ncbi:hypothetical protein AB0B50_38580 [Streptomyces sp. NPDC041068]|uniref:hypothetical protein n=1 Tax=Streptomyces sp. NPDC041068 TaxID=3155130 RepID=UPI0033D07AE0
MPGPTRSVLASTVLASALLTAPATAFAQAPPPNTSASPACNIPDLMREGKGAQEKAEAWCKDVLSEDVKEKVVACAKREVDAARGKPDFDYLEKVMAKCVADALAKDPCASESKEKSERCGKSFLAENPRIKSQAMSWIGEHCQEFVGHIKRFDSPCACGKALAGQL